MSTMTERAQELRLPMHATPEDLEMRWATVLPYGNKLIVAGYFHPGYFAAIYEFLTDDTSSDALLGIREASEELFEDLGHAVAWAIKNA